MSTSFAHTVEASFATLTPTAKRIASYMLANLERLGLETADQIAQQTGTSGISVGRFLRSVGYRNLDDLKHELRGAQSRPWFITDRLGAYRSERSEGSDHTHRHAATHGDSENAAARSLELEVDAIRYVYHLAQGAAYARVAQRIADADAVFIVGIQSTRGIANAFYRYLEYLRPRVFYSDGMSGSYVDSLNSEFASPYLIVTDTRAYSRIARRYCEAAAQRALPFALVTDLYCPWARDFPCDLLQVKTDVGQF
jgi:DNA-binding MurR/RpiR family transcriptional regulator